MFQHQGSARERSLNRLLHTAGALGAAAIIAVACWGTGAAKRGSTVVQAGPDFAKHTRRLRAVHNELAELEEQLGIVEERVQEGNRRIPPEPGESQFINDILRIAGQAGFTIRDYQPVPPVSRVGCQQIRIHVLGSADYRGICQFLDEVSRLPRLTTVETLEIAASESAEPYPIAVTLAVYYTGRTANADATEGGSHG